MENVDESENHMNQNYLPEARAQKHQPRSPKETPGAILYLKNVERPNDHHPGGE